MGREDEDMCKVSYDRFMAVSLSFLHHRQACPCVACMQQRLVLKQ